MSNNMIVRAFQSQNGLDVDGLIGPLTTARAAHVLGVSSLGRAPIPKNRAGLHAVYGDPGPWKKVGKGRIVDLSDQWEAENVRWFRLHTGKRVRFHRLCGDEFVQLFETACGESGYTPKSVQTYNPRVIGGTKRLSMHAYAIAFDVDPRQNPWGGKQRNGDPSLLRQHPEFVAVFESAGWTWGGRWRKGKGDDMHFQRAGT